MLSHYKIGTRLGLAFGAILVLMLASTAFACWRLERDAASIHLMMGEPLTKERLMSDWYTGIHTSVRRTTAVVRSADPSLATFFAAENVEASKFTNEISKGVEALLRDPEEQRRFAGIGEVRKVYLKARDEITTVKAQDPKRAEQLFDETFGAAAKRYLAALQSMRDYQREQLNLLARQVEQDSVRARQLMLLLGGCLAVIGSFFAWSITRSVTRPLRHAVTEARRIASGDLSVPLAPTGARDEAAQLLDALGAMQASLARMIMQIRTMTRTIGHASGEIASGNFDLSNRTEETASNLQQAASSIEQLTGTVRQTADSATTANRLATQAEATAAAGGAVVARVVDTMAGINASSNKIGDIIGVIDAIAFQTNILALNAAVEAARAGEQGRGFSVVAAEVRNLAQRSAEAAKQIKLLIVASVEEISSGTKLVGDAGQAMRDIVTAVQRVSTIISEITVAAGEQRAGIEQVNDAVAQLDQMTQQNAALVEESAAAAQSLNDQASQLERSVDAFRLSET